MFPSIIAPDVPYFLALEFDDKALNSFRSLRWPIAGVDWFDTNPLDYTGGDEWGLLPLCNLRATEAQVEALDQRLQGMDLGALTISMASLTFWVADGFTDICLRVQTNADLERLQQVCLDAAGREDVEARPYEHLVGLARAHGVERSELESYAAKVEPLAPIVTSPDRLLLCARSKFGMTLGKGGPIPRQRTVLFQYFLRHA